MTQFSSRKQQSTRGALVDTLWWPCVCVPRQWWSQQSGKGQQPGLGSSVPVKWRLGWGGGAMVHPETSLTASLPLLGNKGAFSLRSDGRGGCECGPWVRATDAAFCCSLCFPPLCESLCSVFYICHLCFLVSLLSFSLLDSCMSPGLKGPGFVVQTCHNVSHSSNVWATVHLRLNETDKRQFNEGLTCYWHALGLNSHRTTVGLIFM